MLTVNPNYPLVVQEIHSTIIKSDIGTAMKANTKGADLLNVGFRSAQEAIKIDHKTLNEFSQVNAILKNQYLYVNFEVLDDICKKYNIVPSPIAEFTGFVPKKNLEELKVFQDKIAPQLPKSSVGYTILCPQADTTYNLVEKMLEKERQEELIRQERERARTEDPIVLYPLKNGAIIITAWGDEASDPSISNFNFN
jgi:hypothetical protein